MKTASFFKLKKLVCSVQITLCFIFISQQFVHANGLQNDSVQFIQIEEKIVKEKNKSQLPKLQLGLGVGYGIVSDYPASDENSAKELVLPIFIYRGEILKSDQDQGTRAELIKTENLDINMSFGLKFSTKSEDNLARQGMPDLNYLFQLGPSLNYKIIEFSKDSSVTLQLPVRLTIESDFKKWDYLGYIFDPTLRWVNNHVGLQNLRLTTSLSMEYFSEKVAQYYYNVDSKFTRVDRNEYTAQEGLSSVSLGQNLIYTHNSYNFVMGVSYNDYSFSKHKDSPLFKSKQNTTLFMALAWFFYNSPVE